MSDATPIRPTRFEPPENRPHGPSLNLRIGAVITGAALLISAAIAWFLLTGKAVYIETEPAMAQIEITGGLKLKLADRYLLRAGEYQLRITAPGYHPLQRTLTVTEEQDQEYEYSLDRLPGHLAVTSDPVAGAEVYVDGELRGRTPVTVRNLPHGSHSVRLERERYLPSEQTVELEGLDRTRELAVSLEPAWAEVRLVSTPPGAQVFVDEEVIGETPLTAEILQGEHELMIRLDGFKPWQETLDITAGEDLELPPVELLPADALVRIRTRPDGAAVTVNGNYQGLSPLQVSVEPGTATDIRLFKQGYQRVTRNLTLASGEEQALDIDLQAQLASVSVQAQPADAEVLVDGEPHGPANQVLNLTAREHRIEIRKQGYQPFQTTITPRPGVEQAVRVQLKTLRQVMLDSLQPVVTTEGGQEMKLFRPSARFTMGSSRREAGRRANETLREVSLNRIFYLSTREVTNAQYRRFKPGHDSGDVQGNSLDGENQPVVNITWEDAARYCNWLSEQEGLTPFYTIRDGAVTGVASSSTEGYRLPSEAEWAWAARYRPDGSMRKFPWGSDMPPSGKSGNYADESAANLIGRILYEYNDGYTVTAPVGSFPTSDKGLYDIGGNVAEWIHDYYDITIDLSGTVPTDPLGPKRGDHHVIRGSSWAHGGVTELRLAFRDYGSEPRDDVGFRIARYIE